MKTEALINVKTAVSKRGKEAEKCSKISKRPLQRNRASPPFPGLFLDKDVHLQAPLVVSMQS